MGVKEFLDTAKDIKGAIQDPKGTISAALKAKLMPYIVGGACIILLIGMIAALVVGIFESVAGEVEEQNSNSGMDVFSSGAWEQLILFNRLFEDSSLVYSMERKVNAAGEECYEVKPDGGGGSAVGFGVDIATWGSELRAAGYSTSIGSLIPCSVVDRIEDRELRDLYDSITALEQSNGISLTIFQELALTSRCYNYGFAGGTSNGSWFIYPSNLTFVQAYKQYYDNDRDTHYGDWEKTDFNHSLYTQYMTALRYTSGGQPPGWVTRRQDEWCLFQTGYFGYGLHNGSVGFDEYCILSMSSGEGTGYWWPIGSDTTETKNGVEFAKGTPSTIGISRAGGFSGSAYVGDSGSTHIIHETGTAIDIPGTEGVTNVIAIANGTVTRVDNFVSNGDIGTSASQNYGMRKHCLDRLRKWY